MGIEIVFLVLAVAVIVFGIAVVVVNRRSSVRADRPDGRASAPAPTPAPPSTEGTALGADGDVDVGTTAVDEAPVEPVAPPAPPRLRDRLGAARATFASAFAGVRGRSGITDASFDELEEALLRADVGIGITGTLLDDLRARVKSKELTTPDELLDALRAAMATQLHDVDRSLRFDDDVLNIWMFVGVNGVGKTTTIGKVASQQVAGGRSVLLAAGDTFRAAAAEQLETWATRAGAAIVRGSEGGDPSAVVFDAVESAAARGVDLVLADTAGRLHTKTNLMEELRKVRRVAEKGAGKVTETLLVIDATTGQNGLTQAREFHDATDLTGVVLTKLDGSAKGGIVFAIETTLGIPVKLVGIGEAIGDLVAFDPAEFVDDLFAPA